MGEQLAQRETTASSPHGERPRTGLVGGRRDALAGRHAVVEGDVGTATRFAEARDAFSTSHGVVGGPLVWPWRIVPVVSDNLRPPSAMAEAGALAGDAGAGVGRQLHSEVGDFLMVVTDPRGGNKIDHVDRHVGGAERCLVLYRESIAAVAVPGPPLRPCGPVELQLLRPGSQAVSAGGLAWPARPR